MDVKPRVPRTIPMATTRFFIMVSSVIVKWTAARLTVYKTPHFQGILTRVLVFPSSASRLDELAIRLHVHKDPQPDEQTDERRAAIRDKRQRHADDGKKTAHHRHVDERISEEHQRDRTGEKTREERRRIGGDHQRAADEQEIEQEQHRIADQPELLPEHREDEVGVPLGQEIEMRLRAVEPALANDAAGA